MTPWHTSPLFRADRRLTTGRKWTRAETLLFIGAVSAGLWFAIITMVLAIAHAWNAPSIGGWF